MLEVAPSIWRFLVDDIDPRAWASLSFLAGLLVGHRAALGRDRRKDHNDFVRPVRAELMRAAAGPNPYKGLISIEDQDFVQTYLWPWQKRRFRTCLAACATAHNEQAYQDRLGQVLYKDPHAVAAAIRRLIDTLPLR